MRTHEGVLRSWEVPLGLSRELGEKHSSVGEDWGYNGMEIGQEWEGGEQEGRGGWR